jgi:hypothetical protein
MTIDARSFNTGAAFSEPPTPEAVGWLVDLTPLHEVNLSVVGWARLHGRDTLLLGSRGLLQLNSMLLTGSAAQIHTHAVSRRQGTI